MWPTELSGEPNFIDLTALAQWLFKLLWLHPDLDSGGFIALQVEVWARASSHLTPDEVEGALDELIARGWVSVDDDTGELWVRPFIELDTSRKPNMFVSAMRAVQTRRSRTVRHEAWVVIDRLYQENPLTPPANDADEKAWKIYRIESEVGNRFLPALLGLRASQRAQQIGGTITGNRYVPYHRDTQ